MIPRGNARFLAAALWVGAVVTYMLGMYFPIMATKNQFSVFVLSYQELRLFDTVILFWRAREYFLSIVILAFTVFLPTVKYFDLLIKIYPRSNTAGFRYFHFPDKWSMLDVFFVAVLLVNFKLNSSFIVVELEAGVTYLAVSILLRMGAAQILEHTGTTVLSD